MPYSGSPRHVVWSQTSRGEEVLPVNVFETEDNQYVIVTPMPGMEPQNIEAAVMDNVVTIRASRRGPGQERRDYLHHEWTYGPYARRLELPEAVDASRANASFDNGVFTLTLPQRPATRKRIPVERVDLHKTGTIQGHRRGHTGLTGDERRQSNRPKSSTSS